MTSLLDWRSLLWSRTCGNQCRLHPKEKDVTQFRRTTLKTNFRYATTVLCFCCLPWTLISLLCRCAFYCFPKAWSIKTYIFHIEVQVFVANFVTISCAISITLLIGQGGKMPVLIAQEANVKHSSCIATELSNTIYILLYCVLALRMLRNLPTISNEGSEG